MKVPDNGEPFGRRAPRRIAWEAERSEDSATEETEGWHVDVRGICGLRPPSAVSLSHSIFADLYVLKKPHRTFGDKQVNPRNDRTRTHDVDAVVGIHHGAARGRCMTRIL